MQIRTAKEADIPAVLSLYAQLEQNEQRVLPLPQALDIFRRMEVYPQYHVYVAELDGEIVGTFSLAIMDNLAHFGAKSGLIEDVVVGAQHRGRGIGKEIMRYALELCKKNGCYKACLSSNQKRREAHRFYEAFGFRKHGYSFQIDVDA